MLHEEYWPKVKDLGPIDHEIWLNFVSNFRDALQNTGGFKEQYFFTQYEYKLRGHNSADLRARIPILFYGLICGYGYVWTRCVFFWLVSLFSFIIIYLIYAQYNNCYDYSEVWRSTFAGAFPIFFPRNFEFGMLHSFLIITHSIFSSVLLFFGGLSLRLRMRIR